MTFVPWDLPEIDDVHFKVPEKSTKENTGKCSRCGGDRFEHIAKISHGEAGPGEMLAFSLTRDVYTCVKCGELIEFPEVPEGVKPQ